MNRFVGVLLLILVAGITFTDTGAQSPHISVTPAQRFEELDLFTGAKFAAQALVAPKTLRSVVPLYTYRIEDLNGTDNGNNTSSDPPIQRGFTAIVCQPNDSNSRNVYTGYPIVTGDIQGLIAAGTVQQSSATTTSQQPNATTASQQSGQAGGGATDFGDWRSRYCNPEQNTLLLGTSYPISGVPEVAQLWTRRGYWDSTDASRLDFNVQ